MYPVGTMCVLTSDGVRLAYELSTPHVLSRWTFGLGILGLGHCLGFLNLGLVGTLDFYFGLLVCIFGLLWI